MTLPVVAIVGRPNVGKSTLFNRLVGFAKAVVHDRPGVTRDRLYEEAEALDRKFLLVDTGGIEAEATDLLAAMRKQSEIAIAEADVIVFVVDGPKGTMPADLEVADLLRRAQKPVVLAVNKIDGPKHEEHAADFWSLGFDTLVTLSAAHNLGIYELTQAVVDRLPPAEAVELPEEDELTEEEIEDGEFKPAEKVDAIRIAVIGRPNIGKSTLVNKLLGEDRHLVHDAPGTTMDPIDSALEVGGKKYVLVDTAGVRKKGKIEDELERTVSLRSIRSIERCHVSLLMIDATDGPGEQDSRLAELVIERGRGLIVLINKWDLVKDHEEIDAKSTEDVLARRLPHATWAPHLFISAKTGKGVHRVLAMVDQAFENFDRHVPTAKLNRFLEHATHAYQPPQVHHHPVKLQYVTQARVRPPTFVFFTNTPDGVKPPYQRYLANRLREEFDFAGTPLRLLFRKRRKVGEESER